MTTVNSIASGRCEQPQPSPFEQMALTLLRMLERDIDALARRRALTRPTRKAAGRQHATARANAAAAAHIGILPR